MKKYIVEFIGAFFLILTIGCTVIAPGAGDMAPLAIGSALAVMIFAGGHISGAHYNPAVTLAVTLRGKCTWADATGYWVAQILAAIVAAVCVKFLKGATAMAAVTAMTPNVPQALLAEFLYTFALCFMVLNVATAKGTAGNSFYGLAIGFTVLIGAYSVGGISGGAFNPAVAVGISILGLSAWANIWIFLVANLAAGVVAALVFKATNAADDV
ncbi:MAG: aquaporin [Opitutaceae bacterium]|nr:aquaporin [Opitutaceae bacterium]